MNNTHSINMLVNNELLSSNNRNSTNGLLPQTHLQHHQQQQQQQQQSQLLNASERQAALADLFNSLSSLAGNNQLHHQQQLNDSHPNMQLEPPIPPPTSIALSNSIQSAMAATLLQQQQQHQLSSRMRPTHHHIGQIQQRLSPGMNQQSQQQQQQLPINDFFAAAAAAANQAHLFGGPLEQEVQSTSSQQSSLAPQPPQQRINYCTICNKELCNKYFMKTHMLKMHGINLEMEQPEDEGSEGEEQSINTQDQVGSDEERQANEEEAYAAGDEDDEQREQKQSSQAKNLMNDGSWSSSATSKTPQTPSSKKITKRNGNSIVKKQSITSKGATSVLNGFAGNSMGGVVCDICNKELCSKYFLKVHKQNTHGITDYQDPGQFMYPFGNPIAAPNPFMVPTAIAAPNLASSQTFPQTSPLALFANTQQHQHQLPVVEDSAVLTKKSSSGSKKLRLSQGKQQHQAVGSSLFDIEKASQPPNEVNNGVQNKQLECFYRLILAQQQQQQQPQTQQPTPIPAVAAHQPMIPMADPMSSNPMQSLMCFGMMGPTGTMGPAGMSPAMIVDSILRNQHLFNRNHLGALPTKTSVSSSCSNKSKDANNNSSQEIAGSGKKQGNENNKSSKESGSSSSRYFSHYTEACPMCDRRFKSIKWLKTHMMNDHKQEIGAYMQMMMQYLYASKSQQMAAATMAAFEQQQHQNMAQHHLNSQNHAIQQFQQLQQHQHHQPVNMNKCYESVDNSTAHFSLNQNPSLKSAIPTSLTSESTRKRSSLCISSSNNQISQSEYPQDYVIDARRERLDSLSPSVGINLRSPASPSTSKLLAFVQDNPATIPTLSTTTVASSACGIKFELEQLRKVEPTIQCTTGLLNDDEEDDVDDDGGECVEEVGKREVDDDNSGTNTGDDNSRNTECAQVEEDSSRCSDSADSGGRQHQQPQQLQPVIEIKTTGN